MTEIQVYFSEKHIKYLKYYALTHKISFNEAVRVAVENLEALERKEEIKRATLKRG